MDAFDPKYAAADPPRAIRKGNPTSKHMSRHMSNHMSKHMSKHVSKHMPQHITLQYTGPIFFYTKTNAATISSSSVMWSIDVRTAILSEHIGETHVYTHA